jgi:hypothetical protein
MRALPSLTLVILLSACASTGETAMTTAEPAVKSAAASVQALPADEVRLGYKKHAALAQYYRWYQFYENDESPFANALDILDPEVTVKSRLGEAKGHDAYAARVAGLPKAWDNSHRVQDVNVTPNADGTTDLVANIIYLNKGMMPDGTVRSANLTYRTKLKQGEALLPKFTAIDIAQNSDGKVDSFVSAYPENRVRSLLHYWLALIETPNRDVEPFREIFADGFRLNFSTGVVDDFDKFKAWYTGPASAVAASSHVVTSFVVSEIGPNIFGVTAETDWNGILPNGTEMVGRTRLNWVVVDNPADRFAKIKTVNVEMLVPFQPKPKS